VSQSAREVRDEAGRLLFYDGIIEDISERKKAEAATQALAATARALLESLDPAAVTARVTENCRRLLNACSVSVYRLEPGSGDLVAVGHSPADTHDRPRTQRFAAGTGLGAQVTRTRGPHVSRDVLLDPDVRYTPAARTVLEADPERAVMALPLLVGDDVFGALIVRDDTGRLFETAEVTLGQAFADQAAIALNNARLFEEVRTARDFLASVAGNSADGIVAADADGRVTFFSSSAEEIWGRKAAEVAGRPLADLLGESDQAQALLARLQVQGRIQNREITIVDQDGRAIDLSVSFALQRDATAATGLVAVARDMTERRRTEAALRQSEKLAAMSSLVAGVAHELNNPLSVILAHTTLLTRGRTDVGARAAKILHAAERCARLVKNFLALARQHPPARHRVALDEIVRETVELLAYQLRVDGVVVTLDLARDLPVLWADPHQLQQVILNLVTNAQHAVRSLPSERGVTVQTALDAGGRHVRIVVADTGPGVPAAIRGRLFEPFFTTKPVGQGTGLGLSLCQGIVEAHGGTISVDNGPEAGAVFTVVLPVTDVPAAPDAPAVVTDGTDSLRVLIVDDEPDVAEVLADLLSLDGHRSQIVAHGKIALQRLRESAPDVIFSDLRMPELDGPGLYRALEEAGHPLARRFVFVTGDVLSPATRQILERTRTPIVAKPFVLGEVRNVLQLLLGRPA
jgi:two-component system NtrC family sensor kinase